MQIRELTGPQDPTGAAAAMRLQRSRAHDVRRCADGRSDQALVRIAASAVFSAAVTFDQAILAFARQPLECAAYFDNWGVDPVVFTLDDSPIFLQNGFAPRSCASYYALMGLHLRRRVVAVDTDVNASTLAALMRNFGAKYAYVPVSQEHEGRIRHDYGRFLDLIHSSSAAVSGSPDVVRFVFKLK